MAQDKSNKGTEFWLGYGNSISFDVVDYNGINSQEQVLYISAEEAATVTVSVNGTSWSQVISIPANSVNVSIALPKSGADDCRITTEGVFDRAIHVVSTKPIVVYAHQYNTQLSGATMLFPVETYGYTYYSINYKQPPVNSWGKNWFYVIASEDNTRIQVTVTDTTQGGMLPGQTTIVNLNKGQLYNVFGKVSNENESDLTGSKIVSIAGADGNCHPIAVFSGCSRLILCTADGGEVAQQQLFPASAWGTRYLTFHSIIATSNPLTTPFINVFRVMVSDPSSIVKRNGTVLTGLQNNLFYEFTSTSGDYIEADKPILVCQYTHNSNECTGNNMSPLGDPEMMFLPAIEQGIKKATVYNTKNRNITVNYLTIIIPNNGVASLKIDGAGVPAAIRMLHPNNPNYTIVAKRLLGPGAQHTIVSDSAFSAMIFGAGIFESYGYIAGTLINNLNSIGNIQNVYNVSGQPNSFTCPQSPFTLGIKVAYRANSLQWLFSQVPALSPARDTSINNPVPVDSQVINGRKYFTYSLNTSFIFSDTGVYNIPVIYTSPEIDHCSQADRSFVTVIVKPGPVADYNYTYHGCTTDTALFTGLADVNNYTIRQYTWRFDDSSVDTAITTFKKFTTEGNHPVYLKVIADNGCVDDTTRVVTTYPKPLAKFGYNRTICLGDSVFLSDSSTISQGSIATWNWNFADGSNTVRNNNSPFFHPYNTAGSYNAALVVTSDKGCTSDTAVVPIPVNDKPQVSFSFTGKPCVDSSFLFIPVVTANGNTIPIGFWAFGDGQTQTVNNTNAVTHSYASALTNAAVKFTVSGGSGCESDTARQTIAIIHPAPQAGFSISGNSLCPQKDIVFTYTGTDNIQYWWWDFGNGNSTAASPVSRKYNAGGIYPITLRIATTDGCGSLPNTQQLKIYNPPNIDAGPAILKVWNSPAVINAAMNDTGSYRYEWSPAEYLNNAGILNPATNTPNNVLYTLKATGGPGNCEATDTVSVRVLRDLYIPNAFSPNNDTHQDVWNIPAINGNPNARVVIFNRWGQKIFESRGYSQPWDGTYKGIAQPIGAYYYQVQPDINKTKVITGFVMIVR